MILTIDIGNTNTVLGCWKGEKLTLTLRMHTDRDRTADEYSLLIGGLLRDPLRYPGAYSQALCRSFAT